MAANDKEVLMKADHVKVYFKGKKRVRQSKPSMMYPLRS